MKIVLSVPGHLRTVPMNRYVHETLVKMGHDVRVFDFSAHGLYSRAIKSLSRRMFLEGMNRSLLRLVDNFRPDLFLTIFGFDHDGDTIKRIRRAGAKTVCWWLNDPFQFDRSLGQVGHYEHYFTNSKGILDKYRSEGALNVLYLPVGCMPGVHVGREDVANEYDISFAGDWHPIREECLTLIARDFDIAIFGRWGAKLDGKSALKRRIVKDSFFTPEEMVSIFNKSRIVFNLHTWFGRWPYGVNPRVFEANGSAAFQISDHKDEIPEHYEPGAEIVLYRDFGELRELIGHYLDHEAERRSIGRNAAMRSHRDHTYEMRLRELFDECRVG